MASNFEELVFSIIATDKGASAAFDRFRQKVDQTSRTVDLNSQALDKNAKSADKNSLSWNALAATAGANVVPALIGTGVALAGIATAGVAAGAGVTAFAGFAVPSVLKVTAALTGTGGLAAAWGTLDNRQKIAALGVQQLGHQYTTLATAMEPRTFQVFNTALGFANSLLGPTSKLASAAGLGVENFLVQFSRDAGLQEFVSFLAKEAGPAITLLGTDVTNIAHAVFALLQAAGGAGLLELKALTVVISGLTGSITFLSQHAPGLTSAALAIGGVTFALAKLGALGAVTKLTGLADIGPAMLTAARSSATFAVGADGVATALGDVTVASRASAAGMAALDAVNPLGWIALAAAAFGGLAIAIAREKDPVQQVITSLRQQDQATGANISGWAKFAGQLSTTADVQQHVTTAIKSGTLAAGGLYGSLAAARGATTGFTEAGKQASTVVQTLGSFLNGLQQRYGITRTQAIALAQASGVQIDKNGQLIGGFKEATAKADAFGDANVKAKQPVIGLATAVTQLTNAMAKNVTQVLTLQGDDVAWRQALEAATTQLHSNRAGLDSNSAAGLANKAAVLAASNAVVTFADDQLKLHGNLHLASQEIQAQIKWLQQHGDKSKFAAAEIAALRDEEAKIKAQIKSSINVTGSGSWSVIGSSGGHKGVPGFAAGTRGAAPGWAWTGEKGPELVHFVGGETVLPSHVSQAVTSRGYADGVMGSFSGSVPGLTKWVGSEMASTIHALQVATAAAISSAVQSASRSAATFGGGLGKASLRQIEDWWIGAGGPGGGTAHVAAAITGAESGFNPRAVQQGQPYATTGWGLWQITPGNSEPQAGINQQLLNGPANAVAAVAKYRGAGGFSPWTTFEDGAYLQFMDHGGWLPPGPSLVVNNTGQPEQVLPPGGGGPLVSIGQAHFHDEANLAVLSQRLSYAITASGLGR